VVFVSFVDNFLELKDNRLAMDDVGKAKVIESNRSIL
jgi:hypothetical protein